MRRGLMWTAAGMAILAATYGGTVLATPASGFTGTTLAVGRFGEIDIANHMVAALPDSPGKRVWLSLQKTKGESDVYVQSNVWIPGGSTGWHTHPGHSLIIVTAGTVTAYDGDDPSCAPVSYTTGMVSWTPAATTSICCAMKALLMRERSPCS